MIEMKTFLSTILRNYKLIIVPEKSTVYPVFRVTVRAKGGIWLKLEKREIQTK